MMRVRSLAALAFVVAALGMSTQASANLVLNGGFETGTFADWTLAGNSGFISITNLAHSGNFAASFGAVGSDTFLSQSQLLSTTVGASYTLSYWLRNDGGSPNNFSASWGGVVIPGSVLVNAPGQPYTQYTFTEVATTATTDLTFSFRQDPAFWQFDDVSVTLSSATPEPSTLAIGGVSGLLALAYGLRRKRAA
jgi:hypothetical protein